MATRPDIRIEPDRGDGHTPWRPADASVGELLRRLGDDAALLVREEIALAKMEARESAKILAGDLAKVATAAALAAAGGLALTAFLALLVGDLLDNYWLGALIVGGLFLLVGGILLQSALSDLKSGSLRPDDTIESLEEDQRWAQETAEEFKREIRA